MTSGLDSDSKQHKYTQIGTRPEPDLYTIEDTGPSVDLHKLMKKLWRKHLVMMLHLFVIYYSGLSATLFQALATVTVSHSNKVHGTNCAKKPSWTGVAPPSLQWAWPSSSLVCKKIETKLLYVHLKYSLNSAKMSSCSWPQPCWSRPYRQAWPSQGKMD